MIKVFSNKSKEKQNKKEYLGIQQQQIIPEKLLYRKGKWIINMGRIKKISADSINKD